MQVGKTDKQSAMCFEGHIQTIHKQQTVFKHLDLYWHSSNSMKVNILQSESIKNWLLITVALSILWYKK